jgi:membrane protein
MATTLTRGPEDRARGRAADTPTEVPAAGWRDITIRTLKEAKADGVPLLAAGVAFFGLLALAPGLTAAAGIYGLVADPATAGHRVNDLLGAAPSEVRELVASQLEGIVSAPDRQAGIAAVVGVLLALWSASSGMQHLLGALNTAYDEDETRGFVRLRATSLVLTVAAIAFLALTVGVIAAGPALLADTSLGDVTRVVFSILRWPVLAAAMVGALAVLYRYGADRDDPKWRWAAPGSIVATVAWLVGSALFSLYTANFGKYDETYGSLGAIVVVMLWLFLTAYVVVLGAEINAEAERQTAKDTTTGRRRPLGERDAEAADTVGPTADEVKAGTPAGGDVSRTA